jgi:hypothetical protein
LDLSPKSIIFLAAMTFLCFYWLNTKNKAQLATIDDLVQLTCQHGLIQKFEAGLAAQAQDKATTAARPGLESEAYKKRDITPVLQTAIGEIVMNSKTFYKNAGTLSFEGDEKKAAIVGQAVDRAEQECPDLVKDADAAKATMVQFLKVYYRLNP